MRRRRWRPSATSATRGAGDRGGRVAKARADLVDIQFDRDAVVAIPILERALLELALGDHAGALSQRAGDVLRELRPARRAEEQRVAVLPLVRGPVEDARRRRDREVGDRAPGLRVAQLRVGREVADDRDDRVRHDLLGVLLGGDLGLLGGGGGLAGCTLLILDRDLAGASDGLFRTQHLGAHDGFAE